MKLKFHPQHKNRWILGLVFFVIGVATLLIVLSLHKQKEAAAKKPPKPAVPISTTTTYRGDIGVYVEALGTVTPVYTVNVVSRVQGQIVKINYREGQLVHQGDSLIEIDPRPYHAALTQAEGQLARDRAVLKQSQIDFQRYRKAFAKNAIPKQQLDDQEQLVFQTMGTVKADEGTLENAKANLDYCHITSPIDGRVGLRLIDLGNMVQANSTTPLLVITQLQPITVIFNVAEDHLGEIQDQIRNGRTLSVEAYDRTQKKQLAEGKLLTIDNVVDPTTGTVKLRAEFDNEDQSLFPNQFVNARLLVDTQKDQVLVPSAAVQRNAQGPFVYLIQDKKTAKIQKIQVGVVDGNTTAVEGVDVDAVVAVDGFDKLDEGAKVAIRNEVRPGGEPEKFRQMQKGPNP